MTEKFAFPGSLVATLFPFHVAVDREMRVVSLGSRWATFDDSVVAGLRFSEVADFKHPSGDKSFDALIAHPDALVVFTLKSKPGLRFRGQIVASADRSMAVFAGTPWLSSLAELPTWKLTFNDFPPHSPMGDMLLLVQGKDTSLEDARRLAQRAEAELATRTELEQRLRQSQKMEAIGRLAGGIAHDFNNILMAIAGFADFARDDAPQQHPVREWIDRISEACNRASFMTTQLLSFSRQNVRQMTVLDIAEELRTAERLLLPLLGERIVVRFVIDRGVGHVRADASSIQQVVMNLAINARDAMPDGGSLTIRAVDAISGGGDPAFVNHIMIEVVDTGVGMDEKTLSHIFEPFFTTKEASKGTGLGLATVYGIVTQAGGRIDVVSKPGQGSTFRVYLPRVISESVAPAPTTTASPAPTRERVLLVEDEDVVRDLLARTLRKAGYDVHASPLPSEAAAWVAAGNPVDVIVTDVVMPEKSGPELIRDLEVRLPGVPVVFISGYAAAAAPELGRLAPHQRFLPKPFAPPKLLAVVSELLASSK